MPATPHAPISPYPSEVSTAWIEHPGGRPLFVFAHQDDETVIAGLIRRIVGDDERGTFVWWTNGDGLAPAANMSPDPYARLRIAECDEAVQLLGASTDRKIDLRTSEIENYRRFTHVGRAGPLRDRALEYFRHEAWRVEQVVRAADPDRVFVLAWQGGHPEHDLLHVMTACAVQRLRRETGRPIPLIQCPAYEFVIACALRFKPWFAGDQRRIVLSDEELAAKQGVFEAYPSQAQLMANFRAVLTTFGWAAVLIDSRRITPEDWVRVEELGVVDPSLDYRRSTHLFEALNYMLDDFEGIPIRFDTMIRPIVCDLLGG